LPLVLSAKQNLPSPAPWLAMSVRFCSKVGPAPPLPVVGVEILFLADTWARAWCDIPHEPRGGFWRDF
jgi:hypothetical protein